MQSMAATDIVRTNQSDDDDSGLSARQVNALEMLAELGAEPAPQDPETGKSIYSGNPKIRAYQLVFEGRFGGPGKGQGRKREPRAAEVIAEALREEPRVKKMISALDRALTKKAGTRANLDAIKLAHEIEKGERSLQLKEEAHNDTLGTTREELLGTIFELVQQPGVAQAINGESEEITDAEIVNEEDFDRSGEEEAPKPKYAFQTRRASTPRTNGDHGDSGDATTDGRDSRVSGSNGRSRAATDRGEAERPLQALARRRAANKR